MAIGNVFTNKSITSRQGVLFFKGLPIIDFLCPDSNANLDHSSWGSSQESKLPGSILQVVFNNIVGDVASIHFYLCNVKIVISVHGESEITPNTDIFVENGLHNVTIADSSPHPAAIHDVHIFVEDLQIKILETTAT